MHQVIIIINIIINNYNNNIIGATKLVPLPNYNKDWPTLPMWFWPVCGIWELASVALLFNGKEKIALPLLYIFLGGVYSSVTVMDPKKIPIAIVPTCTVLVVSSIGYHQKHSTQYMIPGLGAGFLIGVILSSLGGRKVKSK